MIGREYQTSRSTRVATLIMALIILPLSLYGFGSKFLEFVRIYQGEVEGEFAIAPIVNYLLASSGFFLILLWAIANGMLDDIEGPKYSMLDREWDLDHRPRTRSTAPRNPPINRDPN